MTTVAENQPTRTTFTCPQWCTKAGQHDIDEMGINFCDEANEIRVWIRHAGPTFGPFTLFAEMSVDAGYNDSWAMYDVNMDSINSALRMRLTDGTDAERLRSLAQHALAAAEWIDANTDRDLL